MIWYTEFGIATLVCLAETLDGKDLLSIEVLNLVTRGFTGFRIRFRPWGRQKSCKTRNNIGLYYIHTELSNEMLVLLYLTIIPRTRVGYEFLDSGRSAKH